ncbi:hypothetical protein B0J14DRAFT_657203 [Halenospora varia]|nr:hypothetical protein B0J14DRAFT_657203 [Halenospora varia]
MSSPSPSPRSPKRSHSEDWESPARAAKHQKLDDGKLPEKFKGIKEEAVVALDPLTPPPKRKFGELTHGEDNDYGERTKLLKLDDTTEDEMTRRFKVANWAGMIKRRKETARKLSDDQSRMPPASQRGMPNITGVLCYRIALLQALLHIPLLVNWLLDFVLPEHCVSDSSDECFACVFRKLAQAYWGGSGRPNQASAVFRTMHNTIKRLGWTESGQADPDEQLLFFFKKIQAELPSSIYSLVESVFVSYWRQTIKCGSCDTTSLTIGQETKHTICLAPRLPSTDIQQYIRRVYREIVPYKCENCHITKPRPKVRVFDLTSDILCLQLSRCDAFGRKINLNLDVPRVLDIGNITNQANEDDAKYETVAVVQHKGSSMGGHYICSTIGPDGKWKLFDDEMVNNSSWNSAVNPNRGFTPVLLFFRRVHG